MVDDTKMGKRTSGEAVERLEQIMARLRAPEGCPWDREQDLRSLRPYLVEEAYEVLEEMDRAAYTDNWGPLCEELGDLLFQIVFHAQLGKEANAFTLSDIATAIADKIERRHPHVFGDLKVEGTGGVLANWAKLKAQERKAKHGSEGSVLDGVPAALPALQRAERLTEKASRVGFDWKDIHGVREKLAEELSELDQAIASGDRNQREHELGDVLFSLANLARFLGTAPEDALRQANRRFIQRFHHVEEQLRKQKVPFGEATLPQMEGFWKEAKAQEHLPAILARVELSPKDVQAERALWDLLARALGWHTTLVGAGARYSGGGMELHLSEGTADLSGASLELRIDSEEALARAEEALRKAGARDLSRHPGSVGFVCPSGMRCRLMLHHL